MKGGIAIITPFLRPQGLLLGYIAFARSSFSPGRPPSVMFVGVMSIASIYYLIRGRHVYKFPVTFGQPRDY